METVGIFSIISAMKQQEQRYLSKDYLHSFRDQTEYQHLSEGTSDSTNPVDQEFRSRMVVWCYQIVDFCKFSRDTVAISVNYLDRFLSTTEGIDARKDRKICQLAVMTCLYTAIKIHEIEAIDPTSISDLSKGNYTGEQVVDMERKIIMTLRWHLNPPTPCSFTRQFLSLIPDKTMSRSEKSATMKLAKYQIELSVGEYYFLSNDASCIALASLANAMQATRRGYFQHILQTISKIADIDISSRAFIKCRENLRIALNKTQHRQESRSIPQSSTVNKNTGSKIDVHNSPRGVDSFPTR